MFSTPPTFKRGRQSRAMRAIWEHLDLNLPKPGKRFQFFVLTGPEDEGAQGTKFMSRTMMNGHSNCLGQKIRLSKGFLKHF